MYAIQGIRISRKENDYCRFSQPTENSISEYIQHNCSLCKYVKMYNTLIMSSSIECHAVNYKSVNVDVELAHSKCRDLISIPNLL